MMAAIYNVANKSGHITGPRGLRLVSQRVSAYRKTLRAAGITPESNMVTEGDFTEDSGLLPST
jgi:DNA-binding LacI/PurR family transcriptional regulator